MKEQTGQGRQRHSAFEHRPLAADSMGSKESRESLEFVTTRLPRQSWQHLIVLMAPAFPSQVPARLLDCFNSHL